MYHNQVTPSPDYEMQATLQSRQALGFDNQTMNPSNLPPLPPLPQQLYPSLDQQSQPLPIEHSNGVYVVNAHDNYDAQAARHQYDQEENTNCSRNKTRGAGDHHRDSDEEYDPYRNDTEKKRESLFMRDGKRRIDFVLAYRYHDDKDKKLMRKYFEHNLIDEGLQLEREDRKDQETYFVKIHAPWDFLTRMAELMSLKMPLAKDYNQGLAAPSDDFLSKMPNPFKLPSGLVPEEPNYFTAHFSREKQNIFSIPDKETFFTNAQRSRMVYEILLRTRYDEIDTEKIGVDRLIRHGIYTAAFPLHEGKFTSEHSMLVFGPANDRHLLYESWAKPGRWYCYQPLDLIRKYFGEQIGIYFAWLGFYTMMLIPAAIVGVIVFIYGAATLHKNVPSEEICNVYQAGNLTMCPLCDARCSYWRLHISCLYSKLTYLFDNSATVFFAGFMAIWATTFLEFWKRKQAEIQYDWDMINFEMEEHLRPDFEAKVHHRKLNPITELMEPFLPLWSKIPRKCNSVVVIAFMIMCILVAVFGVVMYRVIIVAIFYASGDHLIRENAKLLTTATAALINLVIIVILNKIYERIALWLTNLERPKTDSEYNDSFTFKMFFFQFINFYSSIFYIAFFKGRFSGRPGAYDYRLQYRGEECDPAGCLIELCIQLGIVMIGKQAFNNFKEVMLPKILNWFRSRTAKKRETKENLYTRCEQDSDLQSISNLCLFEEYLEMVIQYGFVTIFVAAFPLAPFFALINNIIEIRLDAYKFVTQWKRPVAYRAQDIGIWFDILKSISFIAVLTNAFIIGWTSDFMPKLVYQLSTSKDGSLTGYINHSLSYFDVADFQPRSRPDNNRTDEFGVVNLCRYSAFRYPPNAGDELKYQYTTNYWHITVGRLAFVIAFEHIVFFLTWIVSYLIPDIPNEVRQLMLREHHLVREARYIASMTKTTHKKRRKNPKKSPV